MKLFIFIKITFKFVENDTIKLTLSYKIQDNIFFEDAKWGCLVAMVTVIGKLVFSVHIL
jgi:hypothetical protein